MKHALILIMTLLIATSFVAAQTYDRYVPVQKGQPFDSVVDYFNEKYVPKQMDRVTYDTTQRIVVNPTTQQPYVYQPYDYYYGPYTQNSYYKIDNPDLLIEIEEDSYEDGYNHGYYIGYGDGLSFQRFGYEGYYDYIEAAKTKYDPENSRSGYYKFSDRVVKISVSTGPSDYNAGYANGIMEGFKDGFYDVKYRGLNQDYYAFKEYQKTHPGTYTPLSYQSYPRAQFRTFPNFYSWMSGNKYYGFNY
ncbi:MAG: hypothetical protein ABIJ21_03210 [Nanoarchaeota archaeon]